MAVRRPPMVKLPSERITNQLDMVRKQAKNARKSETLTELYEKYNYDEIVCLNLAKNSATCTETREKLAKHSNQVIRLEIAKNSEMLNDENVLKKLSLDHYEIRKQVARSTKSDSIKELLYRSNPHHVDIRKLCIKRLTNMDIVEKLVFSKSPEITVPIYVDDLLSNRNISLRIILLVLKYVRKLSDEQIDLIVEHIENDEISLEEMTKIVTED